MTRRAFWTAVSVVLAVALPALAADVTGKWKMTSTTPRGERTSEIALEQKGEALVVISKDREGNDVRSEGTVKGSEITWTTKRSTPNGEITIVYKGKIDGKTMSGTIELPMGTGEWKAEKVE